MMEHGPAEKDGKLKVGDRVVSVSLRFLLLENFLSFSGNWIEIYFYLIS